MVCMKNMLIIAMVATSLVPPSSTFCMHIIYDDSRRNELLQVKARLQEKTDALVALERQGIRPGLQEIAKHRAGFKAAIEELQDFIPDPGQKYHDNDGLTPTTRAAFIACERDMRNRTRRLAKELEDAFNGVSNEPIAQPQIQASPIGMQRLGAQELAKHKTAFQAAFKKIYDEATKEADFAAFSFSNHDISQFQAMAREVIRQKKETLKELADAFNGVAASAPEPQAMAQKIEKPAALKKLWELANHDYVSGWAATAHSDIDKAFFIEEARQQALVYKEIAKELEAAIAQRDERIAQLQMHTSPQQAITAQHQALASTLSAARAQLQKESITAYELAAINSTKESTIISLEAQLKEKEREIAQLTGKDVSASVQREESRKRIMSTLALFESSKTTGWEASFIEKLKEELR